MYRAEKSPLKGRCGNNWAKAKTAEAEKWGHGTEKGQGSLIPSGSSKGMGSASGLERQDPGSAVTGTSKGGASR